MENKWVLLVIFEILAWASTFFMLYARYRLQSKWGFKIGVFLSILTGIIPQVTLGILNFIQEGKVDLFTLIIILLLLYGLTIGKKHIQKMDQWAKNKFLPSKQGG
ncbi:hypothetical protein [Radiobacillus deserti]|uniref:Uncharacterized protein n=1 Tax=Radiobacillus deserti TaxID=2594883 RepID=A0A516KE07_9BACI|nr:hypothetical protein [Radiobacillus deserti]QDP39620.1 hypothetical protein FN924_05165 [Radiobacillus deserti]